MKRLPMRKIREALRLRADGFSGRQVAQSLAVGRATISEYFRRADVEGLRWPLPADLSDAELERRLFPYSRGEARRAVPQPDWAYVHAELRRKGVIPTVIDQNPCAHLRMPRDMIFHGWSMRLFQAWQHSATMSS